VIPTDEELMIAEHTLAVISADRREHELSDGKGARLQDSTA